jgi:hypothetical protein
MRRHLTGRLLNGLIFEQEVIDHIDEQASVYRLRSIGFRASH